MIEKALAWFYARKGRVFYSMESRNGPNSYDCSSSVYHALKEAGILPASYWIGNTDTLFDALEKNGWVRLPEDVNGEADTQRGDIFIWGIRGNSGGALGHTGMFVDADNVINCRYQAGIVIDNHDWLWSASGCPPYAFYRYVGKPQEAKRVALPEVYYADEVATVFDLRQIRCNRLIDEFDWEDNGVPVSVAVKTDKDGYLLDGEINTGDYFRIVGSTEILDETTENNRRYLQLKMADDEIWVLAERVRELANGDAGTPQPQPRPQLQSVPKTPELQQVPQPKEKPQEQPLAPQPTNEDVMRSIGKLSQDIAKNKSLLEKIKLLFSPETKNGRAVRTFFQGLLGAMGAFTVLYSSPEFSKFIASLDSLTGHTVFSAVIAVIAAVISRLMPVIGAAVEMLKEKYKEKKDA